MLLAIQAPLRLSGAAVARTAWSGAFAALETVLAWIGRYGQDFTGINLAEILDQIAHRDHRRRAARVVNHRSVDEVERLARHLHQDVAFGEDAGEPVVLHDQNASAPLLLHQVNRVGESGRGG